MTHRAGFRKNAFPGNGVNLGYFDILEALRSVCDLEHDLSRLVRRTIQHAVGGARVGEFENLADQNDPTIHQTGDAR